MAWSPLRAAVPAKDAFQRTRSSLADRVWFIQRPVATEASFEGNTTVFEQGDG